MDDHISAASATNDPSPPDTAIPHTAAVTPSATPLLVPLALLAVYVLWGSTYLAIRYGLESYPPFLMAGIRFAFAGALMYGFLRWRGLAAPTLRQWRNCAFVGTLLLAGGNGLVCFAEQSVSSGLAAVMVASMPLFAAVFAGVYGSWPRRAEWIGLLIGFAGVILLSFGGELRGAPLGMLSLLGAAMCWAFGSVWSKHQDMPHPMINTAAQMLCGAVVLTVLGLLAGEHYPAHPTLSATLAIGYLIVAGSILGFSAYVYLLHKVRPALATSYAYINPPIAVLFGMLVAGEHVHALDIVGMLVILTGVAVITLTKSKA